VWHIRLELVSLKKKSPQKNATSLILCILTIGDFGIGNTLIAPVFAIGKIFGLRSVIISELVKDGQIDCSAFKASPQWPIKKILFANSQDNTREMVTKETIVNESGAELGVSAGKVVETASLNAPPPEAKTDVAKEDKHVLSDYIYFLAADDWVGRIKPSMVEGGCVEYLWDISKNPDLKNSAVVKNEIALQGNSLVIKFIEPSLAGTRSALVKEPKTTATISIDLLSGETKVEKTR